MHVKQFFQNIMVCGIEVCIKIGRAVPVGDRVVLKYMMWL
jgi:hypothetical protein